MPTLQTAGSPLERARLRAQLTTAQVAAKLDVHQATVRRWEFGHQPPKHSTVLRLARLYGVQDALDLYPTE